MEPFPKREWFNSSFFTLTICPNIIGSMSVLRPKRRAQRHWLHINNTRPHNAALSLQKTEEACSPDCPSCPLPLIWHPVTSSYSGTWTKNEKARTSDPKTKWSLRWE
jgi:hypothetical protein